MTDFGAVVRLALEVFLAFRDKNKEKKKLKAEAARILREGLRENDPAKITAAFDRLNRLK